MPCLVMFFTQCSDPATWPDPALSSTHLTRLSTKVFVVVNDFVVLIDGLIYIETERAVLFLDLSR